MPHNFGDLLFSPAVKAIQERYGSRRQYARLAEGATRPDRLGPEETAFISARDAFYVATTGANGWPYVQHRGGPAGFLKVIDDRTLGFDDFRGNKQFISTGNLVTDNRVALILLDYPAQARLKILGHAEVFEGEAGREWTGRLRDPDYPAVVERAVIIHMDAFDWNCQQHITARFTAEQIHEALAPFERRIAELERENAELRARA